MHNFWEILSKPDNIPIVIMLFAVFYCLWLAFKQAKVNDELSGENEEEKILEEMRK